MSRNGHCRWRPPPRVRQSIAKAVGAGVRGAAADSHLGDPAEAEQPWGGEESVPKPYSGGSAM